VSPARSALAAAALAVLGARDARAQERARALPCRPTVACNAEIVPAGSFELEAGYSARRVGGSPNGVVHALPVLLKFSATSWLQLQVGGNSLTLGSGDQRLLHIDDAQVIAKFVFGRPFGTGPLLGLSANAFIPTWEGQLGYERTLDLGLVAYASHDFSRLHADLNVFFTVWGVLEPAPAPQALATLALSVDATPGNGLMLEFYGATDAGRLALPDAGVLTGAYISLTPEFVLDAGLDFGLVSSTRTFTWFAGLTWLVGRVYPRSAPRASVGAPPSSAPRAARRRVEIPRR
jgi:hypothetical protein